MKETKFENFLQQQRTTLRDHPGFTNDFTGQVTLHVNQGGLCDITMTQTIGANKQQEKERTK